jgi:hypothetical protein
MGEGPRNHTATIVSIRGFDKDKWATHIITLLADGALPLKEFRADIYEHKDEFTVNEERNLLHMTPNGSSPYISQIFRVNLLERMHTEYGHLSYPRLQGVITGRG